MGKAIQELRMRENIGDNISLIKMNLEKLSTIHIYFELLKLEWNEKLDKYFENNKTDLPLKSLTHVPSNIHMLQSQTENLLRKVLDPLSREGSIQKKLARYYADKDNSLDYYEFKKQETKLEQIDSETFSEVLYPNEIYDIINYFLTKFILRELSFKACKSCGRYFAVTGHSTTEYCDRLFKDTNKTCREIGAVTVYKIKAEENPAIKAYNRAYKTHFARIKYKHMTKAEFQSWAETARKFRDEVLDGKLDLDEYVHWLKF